MSAVFVKPASRTPYILQLKQKAMILGEGSFLLVWLHDGHGRRKV